MAITCDASSVERPSGKKLLPVRLLRRDVMLASLSTAIISAILVLAVDSIGQAAYIFTTIDGPDAVATSIAGINDDGAIVGSFAGDFFRPSHGFVQKDGVFTLIEFPGASETVPFGINNSGDIVGSYVSDKQNGFLFQNNEAAFSAVDLPFSTGVVLTRPNALNNRGQIAGEYVDHPESSQQHGFLDDNGMFTSIDIPGANVTSATGINDNGDIVGFYEDRDGLHGFILHGNEFAPIDVPFQSARDTSAQGINSRGQIVGIYTDDAGVHGYVFSDGVFNAIDVPGALQSLALGINQRGQIVGFYSPGNHGFIATPEENLNDMVTFEPVVESFRTVSNTDGCPSGFVAKFTFDAKLTNTGPSSLSSLVARVSDLTGGNWIQNAGSGDLGARLTVPQVDGFSDGLLGPQESVTVPFSICLRNAQPFNLLVDMMGIADAR
jgi:uncharacterized membrane protein